MVYLGIEKLIDNMISRNLGSKSTLVNRKQKWTSEFEPKNHRNNLDAVSSLNQCWAIIRNKNRLLEVIRVVHRLIITLPWFSKESKDQV
jgi:hypothetical protein